MVEPLVTGDQAARYADPVRSQTDPPNRDVLSTSGVRDPLAVPENVLAARLRPMPERLELALSWNAVAAELRAGLTAIARRPDTSQ